MRSILNIAPFALSVSVTTVARPGERKHCQHLARETMTKLKHVLGGAARTAGEQLERLAPIWPEVRFPR